MTTSLEAKPEAHVEVGSIRFAESLGQKRPALKKSLLKATHRRVALRKTKQTEHPQRLRLEMALHHERTDTRCAYDAHVMLVEVPTGKIRHIAQARANVRKKRSSSCRRFDQRLARIAVERSVDEALSLL